MTQALSALRAQGKRILFVTNNSSKSRAQYVARFASLGIAASAEEVRCGHLVCVSGMAVTHTMLLSSFKKGPVRGGHLEGCTLPCRSGPPSMLVKQRRRCNQSHSPPWSLSLFHAHSDTDVVQQCVTGCCTACFAFWTRLSPLGALSEV